MLGACTTVKAYPLLAAPAVTTTFPVVAPLGTVTPILVEVQLVEVAEVPLNVTVPVVPKVVPVMVTGAPTAPAMIDKFVMFGVTVKLLGLLATPPPVTTTFPVVAPLGTVTEILVEVQFVALAVVPLNVTVPVVPKVVPVIVTPDPTTPVLVDKFAMFGVTVKLLPVLATPLAFTTTFPVVAPLGTVTPMVVAFQLVMGAPIPLNVTVPVP
jgi:hypothetical protein